MSRHSLDQRASLDLDDLLRRDLAPWHKDLRQMGFLKDNELIPSRRAAMMKDCNAIDSKVTSEYNVSTLGVIVLLLSMAGKRK